jgi:hypothetical protein
MLSPMATRSSMSLHAAGILLAAAAAGLIVLTQPGVAAVGLGTLAVAPLAALVLVGPARALTIAGALGYVTALIWAYTSHFSPVYAYNGLIDADPTPTAVLIVATIAALPAAWLPIAVRRPSTIALWTIYLVGYVPTAMVPIYLTGSLEAVLPWELALISAMAVLGAIVRLRPPLIQVPHLSLSGFTWLLVALSVLTFLYIAATFGLHPPPSLSEVYVTRAQFAAVQGGTAVGGYIVPWAANVINPLLMGVGMAQRRPALVALGLLGQLLIYADTGYKAVLFSVVLVPLVYFAIARAARWFGTLAVLGTAATLVGTVGINSQPGDWPIALATRTFATPGHVGWYYYDYFSQHDQYHLSHSFLSWLFASPYSVDAPLLIGSVYFHQGTDANSSLFADAFANFGYPGVIVFIVICAFTLLVIDALARGRDARVIGPTLAIAGLSLGSSGFFTTMLTHGLVLAGVIIALMPPVEIRRAAPGGAG